MNHVVDKTKADILPFTVVAIIVAVGALQLAHTLFNFVARVAAQLFQ